MVSNSHRITGATMIFTALIFMPLQRPQKGCSSSEHHPYAALSILKTFVRGEPPVGSHVGIR